MSTITTSNCDEYTCPLIGDKCSETDTLDIIRQFRELYENKLIEIDKLGCGDSLKLKLKVQEKWIEDLTEQTVMMARVVKELEVEASDRVQMLEDKLKKSAECACEVMRRYQMYDYQFNSHDDYFQRVGYLENDLKNLVEFIRRIREDDRWSIDGLVFYQVHYQDLFGNDGHDCKCGSDIMPIDEGVGREEEEVSRDNQYEIIEQLRKEIEYLRSTGNPEELLDNLRQKNDEYHKLEQSMVDMRQALTEEVACKHDLVLLLKKDIQQLEERCVQSDKQTAFKDDIIKELRREMKQLKQQSSSCESIEKTQIDFEEELKQLEENHQLEVSQLQSTINELRNQITDDGSLEKSSPDHLVRSCRSYVNEESTANHSKLIRNKDEIIQLQNGTLNMIQIDLQEKRRNEKLLEDEIGKRQNEIEQLQEKCKQYEKHLSNAKEQTENLQNAVDLYLNSINVLEASEDRSKLEIEQQRATITNLQEALVNVKQELDEIKGRNQQDVSVAGWAARWFGNSKTDSKSVHDV